MHNTLTTLDLDRFPRVRLAHLPTPLEPLERFSAHLGGPAIYVKRDDCTGGLSLSGNKTRKLEFALAEALAAGAETIVTTGAVQSNHARQTAAAAARIGIPCVLILHQNIQDSAIFLISGNVLIDRILGAEVHIVPAGDDPDECRERIFSELQAAGRKPFFIPCGASTPIGTLGYALAAAETAEQCATAGVKLDHVICASGSAGTQAGLIVGLRGVGETASVLGIALGQERDVQEAVVWDLVQETARLIGGAVPQPSRSDVEVDADYGRDGYAAVEETTLEAVQLVARLEGLVIDPIYTGVAMAGLIGNIRKGRFKKGETVLFVHTGGMLGLFGYIDRVSGRIGAGA